MCKILKFIFNILEQYFYRKALYGKFRKHKLNSLFRIFERRLIERARRRYKRLGNSYIKASKWFYRFKKNNVRLFVHWERGFINV